MITHIYLKKRGFLVRTSPEENNILASRIREKLSRRGIGARGWNPIKIYSIKGIKIGEVSFNGRSWLIAHDGSRQEIPQNGVKTAAQHQAEDWSDFQ